MRSLNRYAVSAEDVHDACLSGASNPNFLRRIATMRGQVAALANDYADKALNCNLYLLAPRKIPIGSAAVANATRQDMKDLYERFMVGTQPGRSHYDAILLSAPFEKCPYCGVGRATTLDHYLPKSRYPQFSVTSDNLVPACKDCQGKKGRHVATSGAAQTLHPYFDEAKFFTTRWIFGTLSGTLPLSIAFNATPPASWDLQDQQRAISHFNAHNLAERYAVESAGELAVLSEVYQHYRDAGDFVNLAADLSRWASGFQNNCANSWQSALFHTLANSTWYCKAANV